MNSNVSLRGVCKSYQMGSESLLALRDINLTIERGEFVSIMGPSGSGKSTLMNIIGLLDTPDSGNVFVNDKDISRLNDIELSRLRGKEIGFVFQTFNLITRLPAIKNVELPMIFQGRPRSYRASVARRYLDEVGLSDRLLHRPGELSGGQRQRVAIARALVNDPSIILADEPTGNLDAKTGEEIMRLFIQLNKNGRTIVMVTHNPEIAAYSQRIIKLKDGEIVEEENRSFVNS